MKIKYIPLGDRVLVEPTKEEEIKSTVIITDSIERGAHVYGEVVKVGKGVFTQNGIRIPMDVTIGSTVMYRQDMVGDTLTLDDVEYLLMRESELLMVSEL